jgi:undecaprenyl-diphosphatase
VNDSISSIIRQRFIGQGRLAFQLIIGTLPAVAIGWLLLDLIENQLRSVTIIFFTTLLFGLLLGWADWRSSKKLTLETLTMQDALIIGIAQAASLIPGTSRSGITITAAMLLGLNRQAASRFSFLLAIPITAAAAIVKLYEFTSINIGIDWSAFAVGGVVSFLTATAAIHFFLKWLNRIGMWPYVLYRLALAAVIYFILLK